MNYQLTILVSNKLDEKARQGVLDVVNKDLGEKVKADLWGVRGLAYPIKHEEKAFYAHYNYETEPATIPVIDRKLKLNEDIVRYLLIKIEEKKLKVNKNSPRLITNVAAKAKKEVSEPVVKETEKEVEPNEEKTEIAEESAEETK